jgi:hypothetical protein
MRGVLLKIARFAGRPMQESRMSTSSSLAKFSNVLGAVGEREEPDRSQPSDPAMKILTILLDGLIPVSDLAERTQLPPSEILDTVEKLRSRRQVEIVELPDRPNMKFIRLTQAGYAVFSA